MGDLVANSLYALALTREEGGWLGDGWGTETREIESTDNDRQFQMIDRAWWSW